MKVLQVLTQLFLAKRHIWWIKYSQFTILRICLKVWLVFLVYMDRYCTKLLKGSLNYNARFSFIPVPNNY